MTAPGIRCSSCLDSGLVASDGTPWPTVLACPELRFEMAEGIIRPQPAICQACSGAAPDGGFADGYVAGHKAALDAARGARALQGIVLPIAMAGRRWVVAPEEGAVTIELRDEIEATSVEAALRAAAARDAG